MSVETIIYFALMGIMVVITVVQIIVAIVRTIKAKKASGETVTASDIWEVLETKLQDSMAIAESMFASSGDASSQYKLDYVLTKMQLACTAAGIVFDEASWSEKISNLCSWAKKVNVTVRTSEQSDVTTEVVTSGNEKVKGVNI